MPPTASTDSIGAQGRVGALDRHDLAVDRHRRRLLALRLGLLDERELQALAVLADEGDLRVGAGGLGHQVEQVERAAARRGEVGHDRARDAAGRSGDHEHAVLRQREARPSVGGLPLLQGDRPAEVVVTTDLDDARVGQGLGHQRLGHLGRGHAGGEVHDLHQRLAALALVGLA